MMCKAQTIVTMSDMTWMIVMKVRTVTGDGDDDFRTRTRQTFVRSDRS